MYQNMCLFCTSARKSCESGSSHVGLMSELNIRGQSFLVFIGGGPAPTFNVSHCCSGLIRSVCFSKFVNELPSPIHMLGLSTPYFEPIHPLGLCKNKYFFVALVGPFL